VGCWCKSVLELSVEMGGHRQWTSRFTEHRCPAEGPSDRVTCFLSPLAVLSHTGDLLSGARLSEYHSGRGTELAQALGWERLSFVWSSCVCSLPFWVAFYS
jgi:hypothetical protein